MLHRCVFPIFATAIALACGTPRQPIQAVGRAEEAVHQADVGAAPEEAPAELQLARDKLARAEKALQQGDHGQARRLAEEAVVDAQLADAKADSAESRASVEAAQRTLDSLRTESDRGVQERVRGIEGGNP
jgi:hypothetical protein